MPVGPPLEGPKCEKLPKPPGGENATPEASDPGTDKVGRTVCWNKSNTMYVGQTQYPAGQPGKKRRHCTP